MTDDAPHPTQLANQPDAETGFGIRLTVLRRGHHSWGPSTSRHLLEISPNDMTPAPLRLPLPVGMVLRWGGGRYEVLTQELDLTAAYDPRAFAPGGSDPTSAYVLAYIVRELPYDAPRGASTTYPNTDF